MPKHKIIEYLKQLELTDEEATIYLTLLQTGPVSVKALAEEIDIKRTTSYLYINSLIDKGLIAKIVKGSQKMVAANDPQESLDFLVKKKIKNAEALKDSFPKMLETITSSLPQLNSSVDDAEIRYYKGKNGVRKIYEDILKAKEQRSFVDSTKIAEIFPDNFKLFINAFKHNPEMKMFEIFQDSSITDDFLKILSQQKNYAYKSLPKGMKLNTQDIIIYDNKVAIISFQNNLSGVVLQNRDLYNNFKLIFDLIWKMLP